MEALDALKSELDDSSIDYSSELSTIFGIFRRLTWPEIYLSKKGKICVPEKFSIKMGGSKHLLRILMQPDIFLSLPIKMVKCILDLMMLILQREPYDIVRFQFNDTIPTSSEAPVLVKLLVRLLEVVSKDAGNLTLSKRILHLIGLTATVGISIQDMKKLMAMLRVPSTLTISILQTVHAMIKLDIGLNKASPTSFFSFGGPGAGMYIHIASFPFVREYQFATWFRVENFDEDVELQSSHHGPSSHKAKAFNASHTTAQHILLWQNPAHKGLDVYVDNKHLVVAVSNHSKMEPTLIKVGDHPLRKGVWYHLSVRHSKPRVALFGSDELCITLDQEVVFQDAVRFPSLGNLVDTEFHIGLNLDGQMSPVYFFHEALSNASLEAMSAIDGGLESELIEANGLNASGHIAADLLPSVTSSDRKIHLILAKMAMAYHPKRCYGTFALDIHSGRHARMGSHTQPWHIINPRDLLGTMGGVTCLLPLFPRLLVENEYLLNNNSFGLDLSSPRSDNMGYGLGTSLVDTGDDGYASAYVDYSVIQAIRATNEDFHGDGSISLLINIVAKCISNHRAHQLELLHGGAVEMIEYAVSCVPPEIMLAEGEKCVLSLLHLKSSAVSMPPLELRVAKLLLCNIALWSGASFAFLSSLLSVMLAAIKAQPETFLRLLGIKPFLDALDIFGNFEFDEFSSPNNSDPTQAPAIGSPHSSCCPAMNSEPLASEGSVSNSELTSSSLMISPLPLDISSPLPSARPGLKTQFSQGGLSASMSPLDGSDPSTLTRNGSGRKGVKFFADDSSAPSSVAKTPRSTMKPSKMRKLKSFKLALSEAMFDDEDEDDATRLGTVMEMIAEHGKSNDDAEEEENVKPKTLRTDNISELSITVDGGPSDVSNMSLSDLRNLEDLSVAKPFESPMTPQTNFQRKQLREHILTIIITLIVQGSSEKELMPLVDYMANCKDKIVLNELAQVLLQLVTEGSSKMISAIITACHGPEEFASFVLVYLIHQAHEELRCSGIRLLTHFYMKVDQASSAALHLSMKKRKNSSLAKALSTLTQSYNAGLQRLQICGGLALLCEVITAHCRASSDLTYSVLLELLMSKPSSTRGAMQYDVLDSASHQNVAANATARSRQGTMIGEVNVFGAKPLRTAIHYLMLDQQHDDSFDLTNPIVMPIFFDLVPKLPLCIQEQIYTDFISILKHSYGFRQAFVACPSWHLCMFGLVSQLINTEEYTFYSKSFHTVDITAELEKWTGMEINEAPFQAEERIKIKHKSSGALLRAWNNTSMHGFREAPKHQSMPNVSRPSPKAAEKIHLNQFDLWFDLGMKIYSTLLNHALEHKHGWKELDRSMALSISNEGYSVAQTILSHLLNEMTFKMRPKYKELQKLAKSGNATENQTATDKLENFLSIMLTASHVALYDRQCVCGRINNFQVCKLRVHIFNDLARKLIQKKSDSRSLDGSETSSVKTVDEMQNLTPNEVRVLSEETEVQLQRRIDAAGSSQNKDQFGDGVDLSCEEYVDFFYIWQDITSETVISSANNDAPSPTAAAATPVATNPYKSTEELLHPLERVHDTLVGKLIIVLQTLRLFDIIFWPHPDASIRNTEMLRFSKDFSSPSSSKSGQEDSSRIQMTMYSAVMRMCMYCLNTLSPMTHLAVTNIKRIKAMVCSIDRISTYNTPTHDWLLVSIASITLNLQRLIFIVEPAYNMIGITDINLRVKTVGPWSDSYDDYDRLSTGDMGCICAAMEDKVLLRKLAQYFNSSPGRNIIRNIRCCLFLLVDAFESHHSKLINSLEERSYRSLWVLVEQIKADVFVSKESPVQPSSPQTIPVRTVSKSVSRIDDVIVDTAGDIFDAPPSGTLSPMPSLNSFKNRSFSIYSESGESASFDANTADPTQDGTAAVNLTYDGFVEDNFSGADILLTLKWLRYPYFYSNVLRSVRVIQALDALDFLEDRSVQRFVKANLLYKEEVENHRDVAIKSVEEMTELKELSREVYEMMLDRSVSRQHSAQLTESVKVKNVAARWYDCLQRFEADWSPWNMDSFANSSSNSLPGVAYYEMSRHRDGKFRNLLLTKLPEPLSHVDAAYFDSKAKDQLTFELSQGGGTVSKEDVVLPTDAVVSARNMNLPFKMLTISGNVRSTSTTKDLANGNAWDDDVEDEDDLTTSIASYNTSKASGDALLGIADMTKIFFQSNEKRPTWTLVFNWPADEKILCILDVTQITLNCSIYGQLCLTNKCIYFHYRKSTQHYSTSKQEVSAKPYVDQRFYIDRIVEAYSRRYLLQNCAIELYFIDNTELFLAFNSLLDLQKFFKILKSQALPLLATPKYLNPKFIFKHSPYTELWKRRLISNFDYLMKLNIISGRSYNDITQYPIFPWILADYTSAEVDLANPAIYRNLSLPMGALNPARLTEFLDRYNTFDDDDIPKFMYGSHYSSAGIVLYYMVRQEPYSSLAIALQNGRFDCPDRMFFNLEKTWQGCNSSMSDVKEMIPEMFYNPNILLNSNRLPLGDLQEGGEVDDVLLPPWASSAFDFIRTHREALESDYVSDHLHSWIDLIFGYKQTGSQAVAARNVFYYLTYENAINIESIEDSLQREAAKAQVTHFGQTPSQLLKKEHPRRLPKEECTAPLCTDVKAMQKIQVFTPHGKQAGKGFGAVLAVRCNADRLVVMHANLTLCYYRWSAFPDSDGTPFTLKPERAKALPSASLTSAEDLLKGVQSEEGNEEADASVPLARAIAPTASNMDASTRGGGLLNQWKNTLKGLGGSRVSLTSNPSPVQISSSTTLYNAARIEQRSGSGSSFHLTKMPSTALNRRTGNLTAFKSMTHKHVALHCPDVLSAGRAFSCGYWDDSLKVHALDSLREVASSSSGHIGGITCLQQGYYYGTLLVTGGADCTMRVWVLEKPSLATALSPEPFYGEPLGDDLASTTVPDSNPLICIHVLWGHSAALSCISYSADLDVIFSAGSDGLLCLHTARKGMYVRTISSMQGASVDLVLATAPGYLLAHSWSTLQVQVFWSNGTQLLTALVPERIECMVAASGGQVVVCGTASGVISFRETHSFDEIHRISLASLGALRCLWFSDDQQFLFAGSADGSFSVLADPEARMRLLNVAMQKTPLLGSAI